MSGCSWERSKSLLDNAQADAEIRKPPSGHLPDRFLKIRFGIAFRHNLGRFQPVRLGAIQKSPKAIPKQPRECRGRFARTRFELIRNDLPLPRLRKARIVPANGLGTGRRAILMTLLCWVPLRLWAFLRDRLSFFAGGPGSSNAGDGGVIRGRDRKPGPPYPRHWPASGWICRRAGRHRLSATSGR